MNVADATGCYSIYGGNLAPTPWSRNSEGRGPAWSNSLFEDNAEFGLGMRLALDEQQELARLLLESLRGDLNSTLFDEILAGSTCREEAGIVAQRRRVETLRALLTGISSEPARRLVELADFLVPKSVWIIGGDGWAYDIGYGGLDHVLASGCDVNILVLDTEVYSNTGGQASKAKPRGAIAKITSGGKAIRRKDLGLMAVSYGDVYVAQIALGANPNQTLKAFHEAVAYPGPSLILAYSQCIAHGIDMSTGMSHQKALVSSGFWPLYRFDPRLGGEHGHPFHLDSRKPTVPFREIAAREGRFAMLARSHPEEAERLFALAQRDIDENWRLYEQLAGVEREAIGIGCEISS